MGEPRMTMKPSLNEEEYFAREELERRQKLAEERQEAALIEERERNRLLHFMRCPKCGMQLEEIAYEGIRLDRCPGCEGIWLDSGELERLRTKEDGFVGRLLGIFRS
jgi:hypothetical protein